MKLHTHCYVLVVTSVNNATYNCIQITWLGREKKFTWIPKSEVPQQLINEYEGGMESEEMILQDLRYGVVRRTVMTRSMARARAVDLRSTRHCLIQMGMFVVQIKNSGRQGSFTHIL